MSDDGGMQWYAEVGQQEEYDAWQDSLRLNELIEAHRKWVKEFNEQEITNEVE